MDGAPDTLDPAVEAPEPPAWRSDVVAWAAPVAIALLIIAILGVTGGFNRAPAEQDAEVGRDRPDRPAGDTGKGSTPLRTAPDGICTLTVT